MAHLSGSFSHPSAGVLTATFRGTFYYTTARDAGFPAGNAGSGNILVRAFVGPNDGTRKYTEPLDRNAPASYLVMDYPGGDVSWPIGSEEIAHVNPSSGLWAYGLMNLRLEIKLTKR